MSSRIAILWLSSGAILLGAGAGCATLQQVMALRDVDFSLDRVADVRLGGLELDRVRSYSDLGVADAARDLLDMALSLAGLGGEPTEVAIWASPVVQTVLGPIRYPSPLILVRGTVGKD
jgi:hypothetical protein